MIRRSLVGVVLILVACAPKTLSPAAQRAYTADQAVLRIGEFQQAVIDASDAKQIDQDKARTIVMWCVTSLQVLKTAPQGWTTVLQGTWTSVRPVVVTNPKLAPWAGVVDTILDLPEVGGA